MDSTSSRPASAPSGASASAAYETRNHAASLGLAHDLVVSAEELRGRLAHGQAFAAREGELVENRPCLGLGILVDDDGSGHVDHSSRVTSMATPTANPPGTAPSRRSRSTLFTMASPALAARRGASSSAPDRTRQRDLGRSRPRSAPEASHSLDEPVEQTRGGRQRNGRITCHPCAQERHAPTVPAQAPSRTAGTSSGTCATEGARDAVGITSAGASPVPTGPSDVDAAKRCEKATGGASMEVGSTTSAGDRSP